MEIKEGRVVCLGHAMSVGDLPDPGPGIQVMDLGGKTILPGFTDAHCHFIPSAVLNEFGVDICTQVNRLHDRGITAVHCMEGFDDDPKDISTRFFTWIAPALPLHIRLFCQYKNPKRVERLLPNLDKPEPKRFH